MDNLMLYLIVSSISILAKCEKSRYLMTEIEKTCEGKEYVIDTWTMENNLMSGIPDFQDYTFYYDNSTGTSYEPSNTQCMLIWSERTIKCTLRIGRVEQIESYKFEDCKMITASGGIGVMFTSLSKDSPIPGCVMTNLRTCRNLGYKDRPFDFPVGDAVASPTWTMKCTNWNKDEQFSIYTSSPLFYLLNNVGLNRFQASIVRETNDDTKSLIDAINKQLIAYNMFYQQFDEIVMSNFDTIIEMVEASSYVHGMMHHYTFLGEQIAEHYSRVREIVDELRTGGNSDRKMLLKEITNGTLCVEPGINNTIIREWNGISIRGKLVPVLLERGKRTWDFRCIGEDLYITSDNKYKFAGECPKTSYINIDLPDSNNDISEYDFYLDKWVFVNKSGMYFLSNETVIVSGVNLTISVARMNISEYVPNISELDYNWNITVETVPYFQFSTITYVPENENKSTMTMLLVLLIAGVLMGVGLVVTLFGKGAASSAIRKILSIALTVDILAIILIYIFEKSTFLRGIFSL